ncbi:uncharacterized protein [Epargyreus clarus]|uniref:uncharacterized protein n=1 Tax=Epargyreus clarus TaxID=520877 RepID=UPI003C2D5847
MVRVWLLLIITLYFVSSSIYVAASSKALSRRKRYIGFPEGSSFSCAGCMTVGTLGNPSPSRFPGIFTFGLNWGIAYELPNASETSSFYQRKFKKPVAQRRSRRDLYQKLEMILDKMGYSGRGCILKTLCETTQRIAPNGDNIVEEIFRILFTWPKTRVLPSEPLEHGIYDTAYHHGIQLESCDRYRCSLSLVDWAQGYYNTPSPNLDMYENLSSIFKSSFG